MSRFRTYSRVGKQNHPGGANFDMAGQIIYLAKATMQDEAELVRWDKLEEEPREVFLDGQFIALSLPFFARLSLKNAVQKLRALGYEIALAEIPMTEITTKNARRGGKPRKTF